MNKRPLSPHLSIYRWQISSVLSITHRLTGVALYAGTGLLAFWLWVSAYRAGVYHDLHDFMSGPVGRVVLIGWTAAFYYHFCNGLRHLWWDTGRGLSLPSMTRSGWLVVIISIMLTALTWGYVLQPGVQP